MKKRHVVILFLILCIIAAMYRYITISISKSKELTVTSYEVPVDLDQSIRIVHLTDLHNVEFGENNDELIDTVISQSPDMIFMTGDMLNKDEENLDIICDLVTSLSENVPVYFSYGNHEAEWEDIFQVNLNDILTDAGAIVLDNEYMDLELKGQQIRIGGYYGYYRQPGMFERTEEERQEELAFADDLENTDKLKLLLCHIPTAWIDWGYMDEYPVDVVFCGHYHGGQIRIPYIGGLYAPYVGFFPDNTIGMFEGEKAACILSSGLGSEGNIPRMNNPAEVVVVDLVAAD